MERSGQKESEGYHVFDEMLFTCSTTIVFQERSKSNILLLAKWLLHILNCYRCNEFVTSIVPRIRYEALDLSYHILYNLSFILQRLSFLSKRKDKTEAHLTLLLGKKQGWLRRLPQSHPGNLQRSLQKSLDFSL